MIMSDFKLTVLKYAESTISEAAFFPDGEKGKKCPIAFLLFLFEIGERKILVDTGCNQLTGFPFTRFCPPVELLDKFGIKKEDITDVIITHSHYDHIALLSEFENATVYIQENEYEKGKKYFNEKANVITFKDEIEVADNIKAVFIGGHSLGSSVVEFTQNNNKYVISGDECYTYECVLKKVRTGASINKERSQYFIDKYCNSDYKVFISHDINLVKGDRKSEVLI